jgi:hypothetical protein
MYIRVHSLHVAADAARDFTQSQRSGAAHGAQDFEAVRREDAPWQFGRGEVDPRTGRLPALRAHRRGQARLRAGKPLNSDRHDVHLRTSRAATSAPIRLAMSAR